jgi:DNA replication ATP-dependent helicase Dna2
MGTRKAPPFRISPSAIARYFFHDCERFLYYSSVTPEERKKLGLPRPRFDHSAVKEAVLQSGYHWEREVVETLLGDRVRVAAGGGELHGRSLSVAETLQALREDLPGRYLYQPTLSPPPLFYQRYNLDRRRVVIHENNPDLIEVLADGRKGRLLRIIDVKRGDILQLTHRVQILFYALQLQAIIEAEGIADTRVDVDTGAVWLGQQTAPETFSLRELRPHLERFLSEDLMRILDGPPEDAAWHLYERCESCDFFDSCRKEMHDRDDVSRLVQLTPRGKQHLRQVAGVQSLTELGRFLRRADADEVLQRCASLAGQRHHLQKRLQALQQGQPSPYGAIAPDLPRGENVALFLTVQQEPLGKTLYLAGALVQMREELRQQILGSLDPEPSL